MTTRYSTVRAGDFAPDFTLPTDAGTLLTLSELRGQRVILFFYPKDSSPGCSIEAQEFSAELPKLKRAGTVVIGVGPGSVRAKARFKDSRGLTVTLLADETAEAAQAFGVWREKQLFGHRYLGVMRTTYLIDVEGRVERVWEDVAHEGHAAEVSAVVRGVAPRPRAAKPKTPTRRAAAKK